MKKLIYVLAGVILVSFTDQKVNVDGLWTGIYKTDNVRERVLVKFEAQNQIELYNGEVSEVNRYTGTYEIQGDSVLKFTYQNSEGKSFTMQGTFNKKRTYVDGVWQTSDKRSGSFYLKKEKLEELLIQP
jgi:hypothetical protein